MQLEKKGSKPALAFLLMMGFGIGILTLVNFGASGTLESVFVFAFIALFSLVASILAKQAGHEPFKWFDGKFNKDDLKWIGIGLAWIFGAVIGITSIVPGTVGILIALFLGGVGLSYVLVKSQNFLSCVAVHASYNVLVVLASQGIFGSIGLSTIPLSQSPIFVPSFAFEGLTPDNILGQMFLQGFAVAPAEELLRIAISIAVSLFTRNLYAMFGISVGAWTMMHAILSYQL